MFSSHCSSEFLRGTRTVDILVNFIDDRESADSRE